jgi:aspartyl-tRNA(Asn)/glutamyl-tRNA(Gln) amidotransferase subunit A
MLNQLTISDLTRKIAAREISAAEAMRACLDRVRKVDGQVKAFLSVDEADAMAQAKAIDAKGGDPRQFPLLGVPIAVKDVLAVKNQRRACRQEPAAELRVENPQELRLAL